MTEVTILHDPRCSKSRETLALIEAHGITPCVIEYLATPPSVAELERILDALDIGPRELMRHDEPEYKDLGLTDPALSRKHLIAAMHAHPRLIQRPIVLANGHAAIGRPPGNVLAILPR